MPPSPAVMLPPPTPPSAIEPWPIPPLDRSYFLPLNAYIYPCFPIIFAFNFDNSASSG